MNKYIDAEKLKRFVGELKKTANRNCCDSWGIVPKALEKVEDFITSLQQEQPEVEIEKEIEEEWEKIEKDYSPSALDKSYIIVSGLIGEKQFSRIANHFYELGLNARKEE